MPNASVARPRQGRALWSHLVAAVGAAAIAAAACGGDGNAGATPAAATEGPPAVDPGAARAPAAAPSPGPTTSLPPNELGRIPVLEYHLIQDRVFDEFERPPARFRQDLEVLYAKGYRPINLTDVLDRTGLQALPKGTSPVIFTFDDASPEQFRWIERDGQLIVDPTSALGIWQDFQKTHPDWGNKAVFCMLPAAGAGHAFFGGKNVQGQKPEWRFKKVQYLQQQGFELCNHTLYHARLDRAGDQVQEFIARGQLAIDSATGGTYKVRSFALPLGMWPKQKSLAWHGSWTDPKTGKTVTYDYPIVLEVSGDPNVNPYDGTWDPHHTNRQIMSGNALEVLLKRLEKPGPQGRYVSDGDPHKVTRPEPATADGKK
ncbi:MAG: polysaccharide deacetylase family protein [Gemmatimonadetes bacterium]|nr:polysaccharide deacetylase family protein [Gemmatimonadota bacterium]